MTRPWSPRLNGILAQAAGILALALVPFIAGTSSILVHVLTLCAMWALLAVSWDFLTGYSGQVSFGHAGFFAAGAYAAALTSLHFGLSPWLGLGCGGIVSAAFGFFVGVPCLRLRGHYLAILTVGFSELLRITVNNLIDVTGGPYGLFDFGGFGKNTTTNIDYLTNYFIALLLMVGSAGLIRWMGWHSRFGLVLRAIRDDEMRAESLGYNTKWFKVAAFVLSAFLAGVGGAFYAYYLGVVSPAVAMIYVTTLAVTMVVFGGLGTTYGAVIGAFSIYGLYEYLQLLTQPVYDLMMEGLILMIVVTFFPRGIYGGIEWALRQTRSAAKRGAMIQRSQR